MLLGDNSKVCNIMVMFSDKHITDSYQKYESMPYCKKIKYLSVIDPTIEGPECHNDILNIEEETTQTDPYPTDNPTNHNHDSLGDMLSSCDTDRG